MNNKIIALIIGAVIIFSGGIYMISRGKDDGSIKITNQTTGQTVNVKEGEFAEVKVNACDVLTESAAKQVLGADAKKGDVSNYDTSSSDVSVSQCIYTAPSKGASILARAAKTKTGADSNKAMFGDQKPAGATDVSGIGDKAYFTSDLHQLNVLKGNNWYIVSNYTGLPRNATVETDSQLAKLLNFK